MRIELHRRSISIISESPQDAAFIEDSLGLINEGNFLELKRKNIRTGPKREDSGVMEYLEARVNE